MPTPENFTQQLNAKRSIVNDTLADLLAQQTDIHENLQDSIRYTLESPGKRIRGALVLFCCELIAGKTNRNAEIAAAAIEMIHTYSLVHDDLPAMDDDDLRRGRPTCHKAYDDATAILTGDGLLTLAFEILATEVDSPPTAIKLIGEFAKAAGPAGMIAGQIADLKAENIKGTEKLLEYIHTNKTAKMISAAAAAGAIAAGADQNQLNALAEYGLKIGLAFQIADDILDVSASSEQLGKTSGKDQKAGKLTYPAVFGLEKAKQTKENLTDHAIAALELFGSNADTLRQMAQSLMERKR